ncbi:MAG TPA: succinate dehydrogenase, cytochrome b556 subunit [Rhodocyclaceae bacterium]|nr:succinate dehydrogenase, cytochrome b556 subunit [Rhodocyclaceae bacterium]
MAEAVVKKARPKYLNLMEIRLPLPGFVSILHRVSGAGLFLCLPLLLWLFGASVGTPAQFDEYRIVISNPLVKLILFGLLWSFLHHFCAGIRFLLLDVHVGGDLPSARMSSVIVLAVSLALTVAIGVKLW